MPEVLLFGATGYTGRLVADALFRRGADFAVAGRNRDELARIASACGGVEVREADAADVGSLVESLRGCRVLLTTVGPFSQLGEAAVEAALRAGVHYIDSCGEGLFVETLTDHYSERARRNGRVLAPAMGFDEVVAEVAATIATEGLTPANLILTYAAPTAASPGTIRSIPGILAARAAFIEDGRVVEVALAERRRWSPLPPPIGPKLALAAPMAELQLAPRHLELASLETYLAMERRQAALLTWAPPLLRRLERVRPLQRALADAAIKLTPRPSRQSTTRSWAVMAEARCGQRWRNVTLRGSDVYGTTAELLAAAAIALASEPLGVAGMLTPIEAFGTDFLHKQLINLDVSVDVYQEAGRH
ncbi:MAG: saccharopine dehydrogenase NADP-binding domain-containing protein [Actinomycetota bacterium]|nr:saccharopine dehydrogenase NADP-binding domain-containing protein [Actinomycetota bacterium]